MPSLISKNKSLIYYLALLLIIIFAYPVLFYPLGRDHAISAYTGMIINEGGVPFKDAWEQKPPLLYFLYSLAFILFGESMKSIRIFDLLCTIATIALLRQFGKCLFGETVGVVTGIFYGMLYLFTNDFWTLSNADGFLMLPTVGALYTCCIAQERNKRLLFLLSGVFIGCVIMIKFTGVVVAAPVFLYLFIMALGGKGGRIRKFLLDSSFIILGIFLVSLAFIFYLFKNQVLDELIYTLFVFNPIYAKHALQLKEKLYADLTIMGFCRKNLLVALPAVFALLRVNVRRPSPKEVLMVSWLAVSLAGVYIQWRFFIYHWLPVLGPLSLLGAYGICKVFTQPLYLAKVRFFAEAKNQFLVLVIVLLAFLTFKPYMRQCLDFYQYKTGSISRWEYFNNYFGKYNQGDFSFLADEEVAEYLKAHTKSDDYIFIWGFGTLVYFLADRKSPSRFIFPICLMAKGHPRYEKWRKELIHDLTVKKPHYIIVLEKDALSWVTGLKGDSLENLKNFPELNQVIENEYSFEKTIEHFHLYKLK